MKRIHTKVAIVTLVGLVMAFVVWFTWQNELAGDRLETAVNQIPLGSTADEADRQIGMAPDRVEVESLVMLNPALFYTAANDKAKTYGVPKPHTIRIWRRGSVGVSVIFNQLGHVVGRTSWRPPRRRTAYFRWLGLPF